MLNRWTNRLLAAAAFAALLPFVPAEARMMLAPDADGYQFIDSSERYGSSHEFEDISATGRRLDLRDDSTVDVLLGFGFEFYGQTYYHIYVSDNGIISFVPGDGNINEQHLPIPQPGSAPGWQTPPFIAPWFDDFDPEAGGAVYFQVKGIEPNRYAVIHWKDMAHRSNPDERFEFEALLYMGSNRILFHYKKTGAGSSTSTIAGGASASVGIQGRDDAGIDYFGKDYLGNEHPASLTDDLKVGFGPVKYGYVGIPQEASPQSGESGNSLSYTIDVVNGKDVPTDFRIEPLPGSSWKVDAPATTGLLQPGEKKTLAITLTVPDGEAAVAEDEIVSFKVTDMEDPAGSNGATGSNTSTQNNEQTAGTASSGVPEIMSVFNLHATCTPAPCYAGDSDLDGVPDGSEAASSRADVARIDRFTAPSGAVLSARVEKFDATDTSAKAPKFSGFSAGETIYGPDKKIFVEGVITARIITGRVAEAARLILTPATAWAKDLTLYIPGRNGSYIKVDDLKWKEEGKNLEKYEEVTLNLADGGFFDADGVSNGVIVVRVAMGVLELPQAKSSAGGNASAGGGGIFWELLLLTAAAAGFRRHGRAAAESLLK